MRVTLFIVIEAFGGIFPVSELLTNERVVNIATCDLVFNTSIYADVTQDRVLRSIILEGSRTKDPMDKSSHAIFCMVDKRSHTTSSGWTKHPTLI